MFFPFLFDYEAASRIVNSFTTPFLHTENDYFRRINLLVASYVIVLSSVISITLREIPTSPHRFEVGDLLLIAPGPTSNATK